MCIVVRGTTCCPISAGRTDENRELREVGIIRREYQPGKVELEADMRVAASFEEAVDALCQPVSIGHVDKPRQTMRGSSSWKKRRPLRREARGLPVAGAAGLTGRTWTVAGSAGPAPRPKRLDTVVTLTSDS